MNENAFDPTAWARLEGPSPMPGVEDRTEDRFSAWWDDAASAQIGVVGSPNSTERMSADILMDKTKESLVGEWVAIPFMQDGVDTLTVGQIMSVEMRNDLLEGTTARSVVSRLGKVPASASEDLYRAEIQVTATFARSSKEHSGAVLPSMMGTVPPSGTPVCLVDNAFIERLFAKQTDDLFFLGTAYSGAKGRRILLPTWVRHFRSGGGGAGDTYHMGIFGKTGSGKSVLAKLLLLGFARHPETSVFVLDPQGEFSRDAWNLPSSDEGFRLKWGEVAEKHFGKRLILVPLRNLVLDSWDLFKDVIGQAVLFQWLGYPRGEKRALAAELLSVHLQKGGFALRELASREAFDEVGKAVCDENFVRRIYATSESATAKLQQAVGYWEVPSMKEDLWRAWSSMASLFDDKRPGTVSVSALVEEVVTGGKVVVVNLSREGLEAGTSIAAGSRNILWNEEIQGMLILRLLSSLRERGEIAYLKGKRLNTMVILDEAHRFIPRGTLDGQKEAIRDLLVEASRETRKYGIGWLLVSQTLASLHQEVVSQLRVLLVGYGLNAGSELQALRELSGGDQRAVSIYQRFPDPHAALEPSSREYNFMLLGPISPLAFSGQPLFLSAFTDPHSFLFANGLEGGSSEPA